jgi:hypothetical protein
VPVNILKEMDDKVYIQAVQAGVLREGMSVQLFH